MAIKLALFIAMTAVTTLASFLPVICFIVWLYYRHKTPGALKERAAIIVSTNKRRAKDIAKLSGTMSDFWLNQNEQEAFIEMHRKKKELSDEVKNMIERGDRSGISKNLDGSFSKRSNLGKQINNVLTNVPPQIDELERKISDLSRRPIERWRSFMNRLEGDPLAGKNNPAYYAVKFRNSFIAWCLSLVCLCFGFGRTSLSDIFRPFLLFVNWFLNSEHQFVRADHDITILVVTSIVLLVRFAGSDKPPLDLVYLEDFSDFSPRPPSVSIYNIDVINPRGNPPSA